MFAYSLTMVRCKVNKYGSVDAVHDALAAAVTEDEWGNARFPAQRSRILDISRDAMRADYTDGKRAIRSAFPAVTWSRI